MSPFQRLTIAANPIWTKGELLKHSLSRLHKEQNSHYTHCTWRKFRFLQKRGREKKEAETKKKTWLIKTNTTDGFGCCTRHLKFTLRVNVINLCLAWSVTWWWPEHNRIIKCCPLKDRDIGTKTPCISLLFIFPEL